MKCEFCGKEFKRLGPHVFQAHSLSAKEYFDRFLKKDEGKCIFCEKKTKFISIPKRYTKTCGGTSCARKLMWKSKDFQDKMSQMRKKIWKNKTLRLNNSNKMKEKWKDIKYQEKMSLSMVKSLQFNEPNKSEKFLLNILNENFKEYDFIFTGNGSKIVCYKRPDFMSEKYKKIIEFYGNYWHQNDSEEKTNNRIKLFKSAGYETLVIWGDELKSKYCVINKINAFLVNIINE